MISIIVLIRNAREFAARCLTSLSLTEAALHIDPSALEYVLIDDCSDASADVPGLVSNFRQSTAAQVRFIRLREHRHYAYGVALGMSLAKGECVLFFSHDMLIPPACVRAMLEVAARGGDVIRPRSQHMDGGDRVVLAPPLRLRNADDVSAFSELVHRHFGGQTTNIRMFIGDAMLIKRSVIDRIGVFDTRFYGFMADIDYGLRALRAGFSVVTAMGAWLHHEGSGVTKSVELAGGDWKAVNLKNRSDTAAAYEKFRAKWNPRLPADLMSLRTTDEFATLLQLPRGAYDEIQPPLELDPAVCEVL
jgi:O-antigen biosynthesis protein